MPTIKTEYLSKDDEWVEDRNKAQIFTVYETANAVAEKLRRDGDDHVFAAIIEDRPLPPPILRRQRDNAPDDFVMPAPKPRRTRKERRVALEQEMRANDEREIEASYAE